MSPTLSTATAPHLRVTLSPTAGFCIKSTTLQPAVIPITEPSDTTITPSSSSQPPPPKVRPQPVEQSTKVFINIAWDKNVPAPPAESDDAIRRAMLGEEDLDEWNGEGWYLPVVVSEARIDKDKAGKPSVVFDCVFNASVKSRTLRDVEFKTFICELALQRVEAQSRLILSRNIGTPNIASKGKLAPRTVLIPNLPQKGPSLASDSDAPKKKLIEEIESPSIPLTPKGILKNGSSVNGKTGGNAASSVQDGIEVPSWSWAKDEARSRTIITVQIPRFTRDLHSSTTLDVTSRTFTLDIPSLYKLDIDLTLPDAALQATWTGERGAAALGLKRVRDFDVDGATAEWRVADGVLVVSL